MSGLKAQTEVTRYQFNVDQYYKMAEVGILPQEGSGELMRGVVYDRSPLVRNRCHPLVKGGVTRFINEDLGLPEWEDDCIRKYTVEEYHVMGETGILTPDDRVELIDGEIVLMPPMSPPHGYVVNLITRLLNRSLGDDEAIIWCQCPITFPGNTEPEPDVALIQPRGDYYRSNLPTPQDTLLLIEVSQSTLRYDRTVKLPLYAIARIPEVWIVNLSDDVVEVYLNPEGSAYQETTTLGRGEVVSPEAFPALSLIVEELLG